MNITSAKDRLVLYKDVLSRMEKVLKNNDLYYGDYGGYCRYLYIILGMEVLRQGHFIEDNLPELAKYKPDQTCGTYWWDHEVPANFELRMSILKEVIKDMENSLQSE